MHKTNDERWHCSCVACEGERASQVKIGCLVIPASLDPQKMLPGTIPFWSPDGWRTSGWSKRFELVDEAPLIVMEEINASDANNGGHLDCVILFSPGRKSVVTSKKWLHVVSSPKGG